MKEDEDKSFPLGEHKLMLAAGDPGDRIQFCEYVSKNLALYSLRNGYPSSPIHSSPPLYDVKDTICPLQQQLISLEVSLQLPYVSALIK